MQLNTNLEVKNTESLSYNCNFGESVKFVYTVQPQDLEGYNSNSNSDKQSDNSGSQPNRKQSLKLKTNKLKQKKHQIIKNLANTTNNANMKNNT